MRGFQTMVFGLISIFVGECLKILKIKYYV